MTILPFSPGDIDAIFFDMDGTLINTDDVEVTKWAQRAARITNSPEQAEAIARKLVMTMELPVNAGFTLLDMVGLDTPAVRLMIALNGSTENETSIPIIEGTPELITRLAEHYTIGVISTRTEQESDTFIQQMGVHEHIAVIAGRDSTWRIKPHPQPVKYAARQLGLDPVRCLLVGDTTVDIKAGIRAGAWTCAVLCGYGEQRELERAGADMILDSTSQLGDLMLNNRK